MKLWNSLLGVFSSDMGIDLGTANTLVYVKGHGIVLREPSVVAIDTETGEVKAVGEEAKKMVGRTPAHIQAIRPLKDGVIANFDVAEKMIRHFIEKVHNRRSAMVSPRIVIGVPSGITEVEKRAVTESALAAGAREALTIEEPLAAAIGANLPVQEASGSMVVDIGGGTTEVAVISLGGMVRSASVRVAGDELDDAVTSHIKKVYNLMIGERTAEDIKMKIGSAFPLDEEMTMEIRGRDLVSGLPKTITISSEEIREALSEPISVILGAVKETLEQTPPELASDIMERGILMAGGGALLRGFDKLMSKETGLPVHVAEDPLTCVVLGAGKYLEEMKNLRSY